VAIETAVGNSTLIQSQVASLLVQPLEQGIDLLAAGPVILDSSSPVRVPRVANGVTAGFVAEGTQISDGDVAFDEVTLLPSTLKGLKVLVKLTNELIRTSVIGLEAVLQTRLVTDVANALDAALWDGAGTSNTIKGVLRQTGIATGTLDLTDADSLIDGWATAMGNKVTPTHWVMTSASFAAVRKLKTATDSSQYLIDPTTIQNGTSLQLFGLPVIITDNIPDLAGPLSRVALVDMSKVVVARDVDAEVKILDQTWGDYDSIGIRVVSRWDTALLQAEAVTLLTEAYAVPEVDPAAVENLVDWRNTDAELVIPIVTAMAKAYTRGRGFDEVGDPNEELAAVIITAAARLTANGRQLGVRDKVDNVEREYRSGFNGWTLAEQAVLNRYRVRAM
jgi:HK97 family phage major capsid protein